MHKIMPARRLFGGAVPLFNSFFFEPIAVLAPLQNISALEMQQENNAPFFNSALCAGDKVPHYMQTMLK